MTTAISSGRFRALVVDDERLARAGLKAMLADHPTLAVVGEAASGVEAADAIRALGPDVVFLDVQMPDRDGFRVLAELSPSERPAIVFVTAHRDYALDAFGVSAVDYLLKPFSRQRFSAAVNRVEQFLRGAAVGRTPAPMTRLPVRDGKRMLFVEPAQVRWFEVEGNYLRLAVDGRFLLWRGTLDTIAARLDPASFVRVSRSAIVNLRRARAIHTRAGGHFEFVMEGGATVRSSRRFRREIRAALAIVPNSARPSAAG